MNSLCFVVCKYLYIYFCCWCWYEDSDFFKSFDSLLVFLSMANTVSSTTWHLKLQVRIDVTVEEAKQLQAQGPRVKSTKRVFEWVI